MGPKITIDSATLANKGLELIEAHFLFGVPYERIEIVVHPTSVVHSLVRFRDGAALAHLGYPDMRVPVSYALTLSRARLDPGADSRPRVRAHPRVPRPPTPTPSPMLTLAREAGLRAEAVPCAFNAANEVAVAAFLKGPLGFLEIAEAVERTLNTVPGGEATRPRRADPGRRRERAGVAEGAPAGLSFADRHPGPGVPDPHPRERGISSRRSRSGCGLAVLHRLSAALVKSAARHRVRHRRDPARRLRRIPGDAPSGREGRRPRLRARPPAAPEALSTRPSALKRALAARITSRPKLRLAEFHERALKLDVPSVEKQGAQISRTRCRPQAYWRAPTWKRVTRNRRRGPLTTSFSPSCSCDRVHGRRLERHQQGVPGAQGRQAQAAGLVVGDQVVGVNGLPVTADQISDMISASHGRPVELTVLQKGNLISLRASAAAGHDRQPLPPRLRARRPAARCRPCDLAVP